MRLRSASPLLAAGLASLLFSVWASNPNVALGGTTFVVTKTSDSADGTCDVDCSLREAVIAANASPGVDVVSLDPANYSLAIVGGGEDASATGDLDILGPLTLVGQTGTMIDGSAMQDRVIDALTTDVVTISNVTIFGGSDIAAAGRGGGIRNAGGTLSLIGVNVSGNASGVFGWGGGIFNNGGILSLVDSTVQGNSAEIGGGIYSIGMTTIVSTRITNNVAARSNGGGGLFNGTVSITDSTIDHNSASLGGGGVGLVSFSTLEMVRTVVSDNFALFSGGGISSPFATMTITDSTISRNQAREGGGGVAHSLGVLRLHRSLVSENTSMSGAGGGLATGHGDILIENTTIHGNAADVGGGVADGGFGTTISYSTISNNSSIHGADNVRADGLLLKNSIVAGGNSSTSCLGPIQSGGHNIDSGHSCNLVDATDHTDADPHLAPLQFNGGPTATRALLVPSPAIDSADLADCPATDQRGFARPSGAGCDIGAYEVDSQLNQGNDQLRAVRDRVCARLGEDHAACLALDDLLAE